MSAKPSGVALAVNEFLVWDELNCHIDDAETDGTVLVSEDPEMAAMEYAENDSDGWTDGLYQRCPQPIMVRDPKGRRFRFEIGAEMVPQFRVTKKETLEG